MTGDADSRVDGAASVITVPADEVIRHIAYFEALPPEEVAALARASVRRRYRPGSAIFAQGEPAAGLYCVVSGRVKAVRYSPHGRELIIRFFVPFETFDEVGALEGGQNPSSAIAAEESEILLIPTAVLAPLLRRYPQVDTRIMTAMAQKLRFAMNRFEQVTLYDVKGRVATFLLAQWRSGSRTCRLSQDELASMLGTVRQVAGRALAELQAAGAIKVRRGAIQILRPQILEAVAQLM